MSEQDYPAPPPDIQPGLPRQEIQPALEETPPAFETSPAVEETPSAFEEAAPVFEQAPSVLEEVPLAPAPVLPRQWRRAAWADWRERLRVRRAWVFYLFALILVLAASLRFVGLDWDQNTHLDPDERFLTMVETSLQWPSSIRQYFDEAHSPLNPRNVGYTSFVYGTLPTTLVKGASLLLNMTDYDHVALVGRAMAALCDLGSIIFLFFLARLLYRDNRIALLAAFLLSTSVLAIQYAHFFVVDSFTTFFIVGALYFLARVQIRGGTWSYVLSGAFFGLALASKISIFVFALVVALVVAYRPWRAWVTTHSLHATWTELKQTVAGFVLMVVAACVAFRIAEPDAFAAIGPGFLGIHLSDRWLSNVIQASQMASGQVDFPPNDQWTQRIPLWFPWTNMVAWGMGLPLGLTAWAGWVVACWRLFRRRQWVHLIPVAWTIIVFLQVGLQWVKTMRYLLPIYPTLALLAAWLLIWLWERARYRQPARRFALPPSWRRGLTAAVVGIVPVGTLLWALAFASIYTRPHSRVAASEWIYAHIPPGSSLSYQGWDDGLPLGIDGKSSDLYKYKIVEMDWYNEDTPQKYQQALGWLDQTEYIIESSNRLYGSIPRLPMRYPMTVRYYHALFNGTLGFKLIKEFTSYPQLFGIQVPDQRAEEAFTVYDHPRVLIWKKTAAYSHQRAAKILNVNWANVVRLTPIQVPLFSSPSTQKSLLLTPKEKALNNQGPTYAQEFPAGSLPMQWPVPVWLFWVEMLGVLALPLTLRLLRRLPDRGVVLSKTVGLLLVGFLTWIAASLHLLSFNSPLILIAAGLVALASLLWGAPLRDVALFLRRHWRRVLIVEAIFLVGFFADLVVRMLYPDLWHGWNGGEKAMDFSYLNGLVRSQTMPPADPWFAGGYMNYYYYGFFLVATLIKLTGVAPSLAYNLAVPTLFALVLASAYTVGYALTRRVGIGLLAAALAVLIGNLYAGIQLAATIMSVSPFHVAVPLLGGAVDFVGGLWQLVSQQLILHHQIFPALGFRGGLYGSTTNWGWDATRVLDGGSTINEFPFFTFLYADLHAHMMDMPIMLAVVALAANAVLGARPWLGGEPRSGEPRAERRGGDAALASVGRALLPGAGLVMLLVGAVIVGATGPTNTWDLPTAVLLIALGVGMSVYLREMDRGIGRGFLMAVGTAIAVAVVYVVLAVKVLYAPFYSHLQSFYSIIPGVALAHTAFDRFLMMWGLFLFIVTSYIVVDLWRGGTVLWLRRQSQAVQFVLFYWPRRERVVHLFRAVYLGQRARGRALVRPTYSLIAAGLSVLLAVVMLALGAPVLALLLALLGLGLAALLQPVRGTATGAGAVLSGLSERARGVVLLLSVLALGITAFCEIGYLRDFLDGGADYRMNTVFKLYEQAWYLFAIASAVALVTLVRAPRVRLSSFKLPALARPAPALGIVATRPMPVTGRERTEVRVAAQTNWWRQLWLAALGLLLLAAVVYPIVETPLRLQDRANSNIWTDAGNPSLGPTLDGTAFVRVALPGEYAALTWLNTHVAGDPTVLSDSNGGYTNFAFRVPWMTGLPDVVQWSGEESQQRYNGQTRSGPPYTPYPTEVNDRVADVSTIYSTTDTALALRLLHKYNVSYIYVGGAERGQAPFDPAGGYPAAGLAKFATMVAQGALTLPYNKDGVQIYKVVK